MTNKEMKREAKDLASCVTDLTQITLKSGALIVLLKLLYKQKIKPRTVCLLLMAYRFNDDKVIDSMLNGCYRGFIKTLEKEVTETEEENKMGFDIH